MITVQLARRLRDSGVKWQPASGDRFVVADRDMDDEVFTLSDMTVEVHEFAHGPVIGFNGTTEWALDSVDEQESVWLPSESQLRELLAGTFRTLERDGTLWRVVIDVAGRTVAVNAGDAAQAYGLALLHLVTGEDVAA
ncbi:MAG: pilus assembly protein CpaE [Jatrophihabitans sp.]